MKFISLCIHMYKIQDLGKVFISSLIMSFLLYFLRFLGLGVFISISVSMMLYFLILIILKEEIFSKIKFI